jgi:glycerol-3-phosphate cytidylyltransferase
MVDTGEKMKKITVYTGGTFDLFHVGHLNLLKVAKQLGDYLIVAVSTNELVRSYKECYPVLNYRQRAAVIREIKYVDKVVKQEKIFDVDQFNKLGGDIFVVGDDWKERYDVHGLNWLRDHDKIVFLPYTKGLSTTDIKRKIIKDTYQIVTSDVKRELNKKKM